MLDNLRRSLSAPSIVVALIAGWAAPAQAAAVWTAFVLATIVLPPLMPVMVGDRAAPARRRRCAAISAPWRGSSARAHAVGLMIVFLAHQAWLMGDAILRTLFRLAIRAGSCWSGPRRPRRRSAAAERFGASTAAWPGRW